MPPSLDDVKQTWRALGQDDPYWAVVSLPEKRGGKWDVPEFMATGERDVARYHEILKNSGGCPAHFRHVLDFGCGVGRLCKAWSQLSDRVTGIDISSTMIERGRGLLRECGNVELILNERDDLQCVTAGEFDLVCSLACLQHMPWPIAVKYIHEFARLGSSDGWVAFQVPARQLGSSWSAKLRRTLVDTLPFGLNAAYRRWRHGSAAVFGMYFTPPSVVLEVAAAAGLKLVHQAPDLTAGEATEGYFYIFRQASAK